MATQPEQNGKICKKGSDHRFVVTGDWIIGGSENPTVRRATRHRMNVICEKCGEGGVVVTKPVNFATLTKPYDYKKEAKQKKTERKNWLGINKEDREL